MLQIDAQELLSIATELALELRVTERRYETQVAFLERRITDLQSENTRVQEQLRKEVKENRHA
jgi:hypothetical protein